jgi:hypothetical protein
MSPHASIAWNVAEYLALFLIVALHEFGHTLACRQVDGTADKVMLRPLGGVAYIDPPPRPGATLWSIAAGQRAIRDALCAVAKRTGTVEEKLADGY